MHSDQKVGTFKGDIVTALAIGAGLFFCASLQAEAASSNQISTGFTTAVLTLDSISNEIQTHHREYIFEDSDFELAIEAPITNIEVELIYGSEYDVTVTWNVNGEERELLRNIYVGFDTGTDTGYFSTLAVATKKQCK